MEGAPIYFNAWAGRSHERGAEDEDDDAELFRQAMRDVRPLQAAAAG